MQRRIFAGFVLLPTTSAVAALTLLLNAARAADNVARGSGVVIGSHGEILTNAHVVKDCMQITVRRSAGDRFAAHLIASDDKNDLAVVSGSAVAQYKIPTIYPGPGFVWRGGLISYAGDFADEIRIAAGLVGQILNGAMPADLPVIKSTKFDLVINLKTAKQLGLTVPQNLLAFADEVIE